MPLRGIRGATTAERNTEEIAFAFFTTTPDLTAEFPALAARRLGWLDVPMLCGHDMAVPQPNPRSVDRCIRVLILYNTDRTQRQMRHAYLHGAHAIKADLDQLRDQLGAVVGRE
jgi:chorismate mutase